MVPLFCHGTGRGTAILSEGGMGREGKVRGGWRRREGTPVLSWKGWEKREGKGTPSCLGGGRGGREGGKGVPVQK